MLHSMSHRRNSSFTCRFFLSYPLEEYKKQPNAHVMNSHHLYGNSDNDIMKRSVSRPVARINRRPIGEVYEIRDALGEGGFGKVFAARRRSDSKSVAVKQIPRSKVLSWGVVS